MSKQKLEYEDLSIQLPKQIMSFLRKTEDDPQDYIEHAVVDYVKMQLETMTPSILISRFDLAIVFYEFLEDDHYMTQ